MAVIKYKDQDGNYQIIPIGGGGSGSGTPAWNNVQEKPFTSIDTSTLQVNNGVLTVIGGSGSGGNGGGTEMTSSDLTSAWNEIFGEDE